jgi:hypothetical protein
VSPRQAPEDLRRVLSDCLVQVNQDPTYSGGGSGFFVAPGYVVTCSHVIRGADNFSRLGQPVSGVWKQLPWTGTVVFASPPPQRRGELGDPSLWPLPDIAVIQLDDAPEHACVRLAHYQLDDQGPDDPPNGTIMHAVVRQAAITRSPTNFPLDEIRYLGPVEGLLALKGDRFQRGMSGSPVLDWRTGKVCGMLKAVPRNTATECLAIPVGDLYHQLPGELAATILLAHDRFHYANPRWVEAQQSFWTRIVDARRADPGGYPRAAPLLQPSEEAELLALAAGLTARGVLTMQDLDRLHELTTADALVRPTLDEPSLRSLVFRMQDRQGPQDRLHPIIEFAEFLAADLLRKGEVRYADSLRDWSTSVTSRMDRLDRSLRRALIRLRNLISQGAGAVAHGDDALRSLVIKLEPFNPPPEPTDPGMFPDPTRREKYIVTVMTYWSDSSGRTVFKSDTPYTLDEAVAAMRPSAYEALLELGPQVLVELVLPVYLFDLAAHLWRLFEQPYPAPLGRSTGREDMPLGALHPVVIRALDRFGKASYRDAAGRWWDRLREQPGIALTWINCEEGNTVAQKSSPLSAEYQRFCLGMSGPAGQGAGYSIMDQAILAGMPVAVWRRVPCSEHSDERNEGTASGYSCDGEAFRAAVESEISSTSLLELPKAAMKIRNGGGSPASELAILWDNPHRGPLPSRLEIGGIYG